MGDMVSTSACICGSAH